MKIERLIRDVLAGISVSFAALALGAAFGVMSGRGAFSGMIAAGIIPIITGLAGGTRLSISGPTGPMTAVSAVIIAFAYDRFRGDKILAEQFITLVFLLTAGCLAVAGIFKTGKLIQYVPRVVILGFMSGIAMVIWVDQTKILFGFGGKEAPAGDPLLNISLAATTFLLILSLPRILHTLGVPKIIMPFIPATLTSIIFMTILTSLLGTDTGKVGLGATIGTWSDFFSLIFAYFPSQRILTVEYVLLALPYALQLTLLGYLDSLLTALIMDHMTKEKSDYDRELVAQGLANGVAALAAGLPGAQATIRSVLLLKEGASTRLGAVVAGVFTLLGFFVLKDYLGLVASAVFIGVLFKAALDVFEKEFLQIYLKYRWYKVKKRNIQFGFIVYTMVLTGFFDLNVAVVSGTILFYVGKKAFGVEDLRSDFVIEQEEKEVEHILFDDRKAIDDEVRES